MKKYILFFAVVLVSMFACEKEKTTTEVAADTPAVAEDRSPNQVTICHLDNISGQFKMLQVNPNALAAHLGHGDYLLDADGDGYTAVGACDGTMNDCDDTNAAINPGATEVCDGIDNNCDTNIDEGVQTTFYADADGDGYGNAAVSQQACSAPQGYVLDNTDCNDNEASAYPGAAEVCNDNIDNDCDEFVDEGCETIFAIAYTDVNTGDGPGFKVGTDVLIAKWVDGPVGSPDGVVGAGDVIVTDQYPLGIDDEGFDYNDPNSFGSFTVQSHTLVSYSANQVTGTLIGEDAAGNEFTFWVKPSGSNPLGTERYMENLGGNTNILTLFQDGLVPTSPDIRGAKITTPSQPNQAVSPVGFPDPVGTDDAFIDVVIDLSVW